MDILSAIRKYQPLFIYISYITGFVICYKLDSDPSPWYLVLALPPIIGAIVSSLRLDNPKYKNNEYEQ